MADAKPASKPVDVPEKATPFGPGDPVPAFDVRSGKTFGERKAAREGKAVEADEDEVENKAVAKKATVKK